VPCSSNLKMSRMLQMSRNPKDGVAAFFQTVH
jgi:hypothetical protein